MKKVGKDTRFSYIKREKWDAVEFKTDNTLIYFLRPLALELYRKIKDYELYSYKFYGINK